MQMFCRLIVLNWGGQLFLEDKGNLQKLKEWFQAAKTNGNVPTSDHGTIDKTIEVINKKL